MKEYILSKEEMQRYDRNTMELLGMSQEVLMERAASTVVSYIMEQFPNRKRTILVVSGNGKNGGDGIAVGRILKEYGYSVDICIPIDEEEYSLGVAHQIKLAKNYEIEVYKELPCKEYDIILDAIFGIGLNRDIEGIYKELIRKLNRKRGYKISVDIPSGINCDTGKVMGIAFEADTTVTFGFYKKGHFLNQGPKHSGTLVRHNVGINQYSFFGQVPDMFMYFGNEDSNNKIDIGRDSAGNKGTFGKVLVLAGREDMSGACVLAAKSALRSGCGMVSVITEEANRGILLAALPEAIVHTYSDPEEIHGLFVEGEKWCDCVAVGPGIGTDDVGQRLLDECITNSRKPLIVDADAINILGRNKKLRERLLELQSNEDSARKLIFTPHIKEFSRLSGKSVSEIKADRSTISREFAKEYNCILVLKDSYTIVTDGKEIFINVIANDAMATAGSGDVLTGIVASFVSQYMKKDKLVEDPKAEPESFIFYAAAMAVYIHSLAGLKSSEMNGRSYMIASDIIEKYGEILV